MTKTPEISEEVLDGLLKEHEKAYPADHVSGKCRNRISKKAIKSEDGADEIDIPHDRAGSFKPQLVQKSQTRMDAFDEKIVHIYACGMSVYEIPYQGVVKNKAVYRALAIRAEGKVEEWENKWDENDPSVSQS